MGIENTFHAQAFRCIAARAGALSGTELKIVLHLAAIANPATLTAESSARCLADAINATERHIRRALDSLEDRRISGCETRSGPLKTVYRLLFLEPDFEIKRQRAEMIERFQRNRLKSVDSDRRLSDAEARRIFGMGGADD